MKKIFKILVVLILVTVGIIWFLGLETKFRYIENELNFKNIEVINNSDFILSLSCFPKMNIKNNSPEGLRVALVFNQVRKDIQINSITIIVTNEFNDEPFELHSVHAVDGFYNWKEEYKSKAQKFYLLPEKFKTVDKDIKAYFIYSWIYDKLNENSDLIKITAKISLSSNGEKYDILKENIFKLKSELIFRSPIRFH